MPPFALQELCGSVGFWCIRGLSQMSWEILGNLDGIFQRRRPVIHRLGGQLRLSLFATWNSGHGLHPIIIKSK